MVITGFSKNVMQLIFLSIDEIWTVIRTDVTGFDEIRTCNHTKRINFPGIRQRDINRGAYTKRLTVYTRLLEYPPFERDCYSPML